MSFSPDLPPPGPTRPPGGQAPPADAITNSPASAAPKAPGLRQESLRLRSGFLLILPWSAALWFAAALVCLSDPGELLPILAVVTGAFLALFWLWVVLFSPGPPQSLREVCSWLSVPLVCLAGIVVASGPGLGLSLRVALCQKQLRAYVASVPPGTRGTHPPRWVGLFSVDETEEHQGAVLLYTSSGFLDRYGVAYVPSGKEPPGKFSFTHLYGPWYRFRWKF